MELCWWTSGVKVLGHPYNLPCTSDHTVAELGICKSSISLKGLERYLWSTHFNSQRIRLLPYVWVDFPYNQCWMHDLAQEDYIVMLHGLWCNHSKLLDLLLSASEQNFSRASNDHLHKTVCASWNGLLYACSHLWFTYLLSHSAIHMTSSNKLSCKTVNYSLRLCYKLIIDKTDKDPSI